MQISCHQYIPISTIIFLLQVKRCTQYINSFGDVSDISQTIAISYTHCACTAAAVNSFFLYIYIYMYNFLFTERARSFDTVFSIYATGTVKIDLQILCQSSIFTIFRYYMYILTLTAKYFDPITDIVGR